MNVSDSDTLSSRLQPAARARAGGSGRLPDGFVLAVPAGLALNLAVGVLVLEQGTGAVLAGLVYLLTALVVGVGLRRHYPHRRMGACNGITLMRVALTTALLAPLIAGHAAGWAVAAIATVSLALDGVDGFLARRSGLCSQFGARFDMEVDAALALVLALHALVGTPVGAEVLILGMMRYAFIGATLVWPWMTAPLPASFLRKTVCVVQLATLIALQIPQMPADAAILLTRAASVALAWSFSNDAFWLWKRQ